MSKTKQVLEWLKDGKPLTRVMAMQMFDVQHLPSIILNLRLKGYNIDTEMVKNESGEHFSRYVMSK